MNFNYKLTGTGWSEATFEEDGTAVSVTASYLSDALGDLARVAVMVLDGSDYNRISFDEEPGEYRWIFRGLSSIDVSLQIREFDRLWGNEPDEKGGVVFAHSFRRRDFAWLIAGALQKILDEHGEEGYLQRWVEHPFPRSEYARLKAMLHNTKPNDPRDPTA